MKRKWPRHCLVFWPFCSRPTHYCGLRLCFRRLEQAADHKAWRLFMSCVSVLGSPCHFPFVGQDDAAWQELYCRGCLHLPREEEGHRYCPGDLTVTFSFTLCEVWLSNSALFSCFAPEWPVSVPSILMMVAIGDPYGPSNIPSYVTSPSS